MSMEHRIQRAFDLQMPDILDTIEADCCEKQKTVPIRRKLKYDGKRLESLATAASLVLLIGTIGAGIVYFNWFYDGGFTDPTQTGVSDPSSPSHPEPDPELAQRLKEDALKTFAPQKPDISAVSVENRYDPDAPEKRIGYCVSVPMGDFTYIFAYNMSGILQDIEGRVVPGAAEARILPQVALRRADVSVRREFPDFTDAMNQMQMLLCEEGDTPYYEIVLTQYFRGYIYKYDCRINAIDCGVMEEFFYRNQYTKDVVSAFTTALKDAGMDRIGNEVLSFETEVNGIYGMEPHFYYVFYHGNDRYRYRISRETLKILEREKETADNQDLQHGRIVYEQEIRDLAMAHLGLGIDDVYRLQIDKYQESGMYHYAYMNDWLVKIDFAGNIVSTQPSEWTRPEEFGMGWLAARKIAVNQLNGGNDFIQFTYSTSNVDGGVYCISVTTSNNTGGSGTFYINSITGVIRYKMPTGLNVDTAQTIAFLQAGVTEESVSGLNMSNQPDGYGNAVRRVCFVSDNAFYSYDLDPVTGAVLRRSVVGEIQGENVQQQRILQAIAYTGGGREQQDKALFVHLQGRHYVLYGQENIRYCVVFEEVTGHLISAWANVQTNQAETYPMDPDEIRQRVLQFAKLSQEQLDMIASDPQRYAPVTIFAPAEASLQYQLTLYLEDETVVFTVDMYTGIVLSQKKI